MEYNYNCRKKVSKNKLAVLKHFYSRHRHQAIESVKPGVKYREVGNIIQKHAQSEGFSVVRSYCGHGKTHFSIKIKNLDDQILYLWHLICKFADSRWKKLIKNASFKVKKGLLNEDSVFAVHNNETFLLLLTKSGRFSQF